MRNLVTSCENIFSLHITFEEIPAAYLIVKNKFMFSCPCTRLPACLSNPKNLWTKWQIFMNLYECHATSVRILQFSTNSNSNMEVVRTSEVEVPLATLTVGSWNLVQ